MSPVLRLRVEVLVLAAAMTLIACRTDSPASEAFDAARWHAHPPASQPRDNPRYRMAGDLIDRRLRPGTARADVRTLLGPPDHGSDQHDWWLLGFPPLRMDPATLVIEYDSEGRIRAARVQLN